MKALFAKALPVAALAVAVDLGLKVLVRHGLVLCSPPLSGCQRLELAGLLRVVRVENPDSAFSLFHGPLVWALVALGLILLPLYASRLKQVGSASALAIGLQAGGALANLLDRLAHGRVTDFIYLGGSSVFNPADVFLAVGMALAVWVLLQRRQTGNAQQAMAGRPR